MKRKRKTLREILELIKIATNMFRFYMRSNRKMYQSFHINNIFVIHNVMSPLLFFENEKKKEKS